MNGEQLKVQKQALREMLSQLERIDVKCATCKHTKGVSCMKFDATPPDDVRELGCEAWEFDGIPF